MGVGSAVDIERYGGSSEGPAQVEDSAAPQPGSFESAVALTQEANAQGDQVDQVEMPSHPLLQFFNYLHLPADKQKISAPFQKLAKELLTGLPPNSETTTALRKLLEAKDCAVRASLMH